MRPKEIGLTLMVSLIYMITDLNVGINIVLSGNQKSSIRLKKNLYKDCLVTLYFKYSKYLDECYKPYIFLYFWYVAYCGEKPL